MPFKLRLLGYVSYASVVEARVAERKLHKKLRAKRLEGEWFKLTPKTRAFIAVLWVTPHPFRRRRRRLIQGFRQS